MNKLEIINLTKKYGNKTALNNFTYTFENGVYGLIGPNGAGKSTLMNILVDGISKTNGDVLYNGEKIEKLGKEYRNIIGYVPQQQGIYNNFSAEDFLNYMANLKGLNKKGISSKIKEVLEFVDLYGVRKNKLGGFSGGMKQRILIAQALLNNPEILILDEPTAGLDPKERIRIRNLIARISMNKIVIISTHIVSDIEFIAGNIVFLYGGELIRKESPKELLKELENQVFEKIISEEQVESYNEKFLVSGLMSASTGIKIRYIDNDKLTDDEYAVEPNLEDYYLYIEKIKMWLRTSEYEWTRYDSKYKWQTN